MTTFTLVATGQTTTDLATIEGSVREALTAAGVRLVACSWAPDADTISDAVGGGAVTVVDLN